MINKALLKYRYRLLIYFSFLIAFVVGVFIILSSRQSKGYSISNLLSELKVCNSNIYKDLSAGKSYEKIITPASIDFTLLDTLGYVLYDSRQKSMSYIENQAFESEVAKASGYGEGSALRSEREEYLFYAKKYSGCLLRTCIKFRTEKPMQIERDNVYMAIITVILVAFIIATIIISGILTRPLKNFNKFVLALKSEKKDFSNIDFGHDDFGEAGKNIADAFTQLEKAKLYKQQLSHNIAHELKTPVTGISAYLETVLSSKDMPAEQARKFLEKAYLQTLRLSKLIAEVSTLNKLDEGEQAYTIEQVNISQCLKDVLEEIGYKLEANNVTFNALISSTLIINGCYTLIYSIFKNLLDNSVEHGGAGCKISLSAGISQQVGDKNYKINFTYSDTGKGVPEEALGRIFERFYRVEEGRTRKTGGSGLGLAIVKNAVLYHKGTISASARQGGGIVFKFYLYSLPS